ncbi:SRPBCC family protein [Apibacter sp. HY039]|uniref:SRPBCC family protein n=1 Tax=Apibacter sp. HY039 TaxID=2501476 RepID=UPI000FEBD528|nr:SRPBCC family protein [Apibacter sp. HY039]
MNITGEKTLVNKSAEEVYAITSQPVEYEKFMPENIDKFEATEDGFVFALKGMPEIGLKVEERIPNSKVVFTSAKESLNFNLSLFIQSLSENSSEIQFIFEGKFNMFISAMVEKPLKNFIKSLTEGISKI